MLNYNGLMLNNNGLYLADYVVHRNLNLDDGWAEIYDMKNSAYNKPSWMWQESLDWHAEQIYPDLTSTYQNSTVRYDRWMPTVHRANVDIEIPNLEDLTYMLVSVQHMPHSVGRNANVSSGMNRLSSYFNFPGAGLFQCCNTATTNTATTYNSESQAKQLAQGARYEFICNGVQDVFINSADIEQISAKCTMTTYRPSLTTLLIKNNGTSCDYSAYHKGSNWEYGSQSGKIQYVYISSGTNNNALKFHDKFDISLLNCQQYEPDYDTWCWAGYMFSKISISACYSALDTNKLNELMNVMYYD